MEETQGERHSGRPDVFAPHPTQPGTMVKVGPTGVDMRGFEGEYYKKDEPAGSKPYGLKRLKGRAATEAAYNHTHILQNQEHRWEGTKEQFVEQFSTEPVEEVELEEEVDKTSAVRTYRKDEVLPTKKPRTEEDEQRLEEETKALAEPESESESEGEPPAV